MLKAVKECMKNWLMVHERLYWYIVIGLAVLAFGVVTAVGCAKVYDANAAETSDGVYYPNFKDCDFGEHVDAVSSILEKYPYVAVCVTSNQDNNAYRFVFGSKPLPYVAGSSSVSLCFYAIVDVVEYFDGRVLCSVRDDNSMQVDVLVHQYEGTYKLIGTNFELTPYNSYSGQYADKVALLPQNNLVHPKDYIETLYSPDAPYVTFERLEVVNKMAQGTAVLGHIDNLYTEYFAPSTWTYNGKINDMHEADSGYVLNVKFNVEIPTIEYVRELYNEFGYDADIGRIVLRRNKELVDYWNKDLKAESRTFTVEYSMELYPDEDGVFSYTFTFVEWEYLLRTVSDELVSEFGTYDSYWRSILLSFMHVKKITSEVLATRSDSIVYGGYTTDLFERGIYDSCAEAVTGVDKNFVSSDLLEDLINDDLRVAEREHLKELEDKINSLEGQLGSMSSINGAFTGDLNGSDLWSGFVGLVSGLGSIAPAIQSLSLLSGVVFGFLPVQMAGIISTTVFAICVVAIIKALRG